MLETTTAVLAPETSADETEELDESWRGAAACVGQTHLFFPPLAERPQARARREAKAAELCRSCAVNTDCRDFARENREFGYWGGENEEERTNAGFAVPNPIGARRRQAG